MKFKNRSDAGKQLAKKLEAFAGRNDVIVLALPRGGVPVAFEVAKALRAPLDVFLVRKLGVPGQEELAMGAIASSGVRVLNDEVVRYLNIGADEIESVVSREQRELDRRTELYRGSRAPLDLTDQIVIVIDDGLATGATMRAAVTALRRLEPRQIVVAVPVAAPQTCAQFQAIADDCVCAATPAPFDGVGLWYADFSQTTDEEVCYLLDAANQTANRRVA